MALVGGVRAGNTFRPTLDLGGSVRVRFEDQRGFNAKSYGATLDDSFLLERTRIDLDWRFRPRERLFVQLQDNRVHGCDLVLADFTGASPYQDLLDLRQAYVDRKAPARGGWGYRLGRQAISYRDGRVFGPGDWGNTGRYAWDSLGLRLHTDVLDLDVFAAQRILFEPRDFDEKHHPYHVYAAYGRHGSDDAARDVFYVVKQDSEELERHSLGGFYRQRQGSIEVEGTMVLQLGSEGADDVRALGWHLGTGGTLPGRRQTRLGVDWTVGSGDEDPADGIAGTFDGVFGVVAKYYGRMNLFCWMNLQDLQVSVATTPRPGVRLTVDLHWFHLDEASDAWYYCTGTSVARDATGASGDYLGRELDAVLVWKARKDLELQAGRAHFAPGTFARNQGKGQGADWSFLQATWSF